MVANKVFYSRIDIELVNEQVRLFYSALDEVKIEYNEHSFIMTEYVFLKIEEHFDYYPFEKTVIHFKENGKHDIVTELIFKAPQFDKAEMHHVFNACNELSKKLKKGSTLTKKDKDELLELPTNYMICVLNELPNAYAKLVDLKPILRTLEDKSPYIRYKEAVRVLRKVNHQ